MKEVEVGPGDSFEAKPVVYNDATEEMYVFLEIQMPATADEPLYSFDVADEWTLVESGDATVVYAYASAEMTVRSPGDSTTALTEQMTMKEISNAEYAGIEDINLTITGYAIGTQGVDTDPADAWKECKTIGDIQ